MQIFTYLSVIESIWVSADYIIIIHIFVHFSIQINFNEFLVLHDTIRFNDGYRVFDVARKYIWMVREKHFSIFNLMNRNLVVLDVLNVTLISKPSKCDNIAVVVLLFIFSLNTLQIINIQLIFIVTLIHKIHLHYVDYIINRSMNFYFFFLSLNFI